jgi:hypothetical protein
MAINRIVVRGEGVREERLAAAEIYPGELVLVDSAGKFNVHGTEGGEALRCFAIEDSLQGNPTSTAYAAGKLVQAKYMKSGDKVMAMLKAGVDVVIGEQLISDGDGTLVGASDITGGSTVNDVIGVADEAKDLTATGAANTLIKIIVK